MAKTPRKRTHWDQLPWEQDEVAQRFVEAHPAGAELQDIAEALGVSNQRVSQICLSAMRKVAVVLQQRGVTP